MSWFSESTVWLKPTALTVSLMVLWTWESVSPFFRQQRRNWRHAGRNLAVAVLNTVVLGFLFGAVTVSVAEWAQTKQLGVLHQWNAPGALKLIVAVLLLDGWLYLWHRANHVIPWLWRFHRMHHADREMDATTALRFHLGELAQSAVLRLGLIPLLGLTASQIVVSESLVVVATLFHHANISVGMFDRWLRLCVVTPFFHKVHHSHEREETNSNYGTLFSWWDRLGGTFRQRDDYSAIHFGVHEFDDPRWETVTGMLSIPLKRSATEDYVPGEDHRRPGKHSSDAESVTNR